MVLASQSSRQSPRGRFMTNGGGRRRPLRTLLLLALVLAVVVLVVWFGYKALTGSGSSDVTVRTGPVGQKELQGDAAPAEVAPTAMTPAQTAQPAVIGAIEAKEMGGDKPAVGNTTPMVPLQPAQPVTAPQATNAPAGNAAVIGAPATTTAANDGGSVMALDAAIKLSETDPVRARVALTRLLEGSALGTADRMRGYDAINKINGVLVFSNRVVATDPLTMQYKVQEGDSLARIAKTQKLDCDWRFLQRINGITNPSGLRVGQSLKLVKGPFHGEVRKAEYRLNIYLGEGQEQVMVASYPIGLGELNTTPTGMFMVRPSSKLIDPEWRNPRTGEFFQSNDPKNPIGERWIGLKGMEPHNKNFEGYGIHGTTDLDSIGQQRSMGCVRMRPMDVEMVYELITEPNSTITIAP